MGGLHSGRKRQHTCIDDCLTIDTTWLKQQKLLQNGSQFFSIAWRKWREIDFSKRTEQEYKVSARISSGEHPTLTLAYHTTHTIDDRVVEERDHKHAIHLVSTSPNYGGQRWWFTAPCCGRRVRVLYINPKSDVGKFAPLCRNCQELHYASQCSSYIARHVTYEKHLLSNYGYTWAFDRYHFMKEHYFEVTPEYWFKAERSQLTRQLHMMKLFISCERLILKSRMQTLKALSLEGRREFFEDLATDPSKAEDLAEYQHLANIMIMRGIIPADDSGDQASNPEPQSEESEIMSLQLARWIIEQDETAEELKELCEKVAA